MNIIELINNQIKELVNENADKMAAVFESTNEIAVNFGVKIAEVTNGKNEGKTELKSSISFIEAKIQYTKKSFIDPNQLQLPGTE